MFKSKLNLSLFLVIWAGLTYFVPLTGNNRSSFLAIPSSLNSISGSIEYRGLDKNVDYGGHGLSLDSQKRIFSALILGDSEKKEIESSTLVTKSASRLFAEPIKPSQLREIKVSKLSEGSHEWILHVAMQVTLKTGEPKPFQVILDVGKYVGQIKWDPKKKTVVRDQYRLLTTLRRRFEERAKQLSRRVDWLNRVVSIDDFDEVKLKPITGNPDIEGEFLTIFAYATRPMNSLELNFYEVSGEPRVGTFNTVTSEDYLSFQKLEAVPYHQETQNALHGYGDVIYSSKISRLFLERMIEAISMEALAGVSVSNSLFSPNSGDFNWIVEKDTLTRIAARSGYITTIMITNVPDYFMNLAVIQGVRNFIFAYSYFKTKSRNTNISMKMFAPETILHGFTRACVEWHEEVIEGLEFALRVMERSSDPSSRRERLAADVTQIETTLKEMIQILSTLPETERRSFFEGFMKWRLDESETGDWDLKGYLDWKKKKARLHVQWKRVGEVTHYGDYGKAVTHWKQMVSLCVLGTVEWEGRRSEVADSSLLAKTLSSIKGYSVAPSQLVDIEIERVNEAGDQWIVLVRGKVLKQTTSERQENGSKANGDNVVEDPFEIILNLSKNIGEGYPYSRSFDSLHQYTVLRTLQTRFRDQARQLQREQDWGNSIVTVYDHQTLRLDEMTVQAYTSERLDVFELNGAWIPNGYRLAGRKNDVNYFSVIYSKGETELLIEEMLKSVFMAFLAGVKVNDLNIQSSDFPVEDKGGFKRLIWIAPRRAEFVSLPNRKDWIQFLKYWKEDPLLSQSAHPIIENWDYSKVMDVDGRLYDSFYGGRSERFSEEEIFMGALRAFINWYPDDQIEEAIHQAVSLAAKGLVTEDRSGFLTQWDIAIKNLRKFPKDKRYTLLTALLNWRTELGEKVGIQVLTDEKQFSQLRPISARFYSMEKIRQRVQEVCQKLDRNRGDLLPLEPKIFSYNLGSPIRFTIGDQVFWIAEGRDLESSLVQQTLLEKYSKEFTRIRGAENLFHFFVTTPNLGEEWNQKSQTRKGSTITELPEGKEVKIADNAVSIVRRGRSVEIQKIAKSREVRVYDWFPPQERSSAKLESLRLVAHGDVHGALKEFKRNLFSVGLVDQQGNWIGGNNILVVMGDLIDRGIYSRQTYEWVKMLQQQAEVSGGKLIWLLGNHELNVLQKKWDFLLKTFMEVEGLSLIESIKEVRTLREKIKQDVLNGNIRASYLADNGWVFVHGGLRSKIRQQLIEEVAEEQNKKPAQVTLQEMVNRANDVLKQAVESDDYSHPIFWIGSIRGGSDEVGGLFWSDFEELQGSPLAHQASHVVGHSVEGLIVASQEKGKGIIIDIDTGLVFSQGGSGTEVLVMEGNRNKGTIKAVGYTQGEHTERTIAIYDSSRVEEEWDKIVHHLSTIDSGIQIERDPQAILQNL